MTRNLALIFLSIFSSLVSGQDSVVSAEDGKINVVNEYFSSSYEEARNKFLKASQEAGASIESYKNPEVDEDGSSLFLDAAFIGSKDAKTILILASGTHGVEGFAGSALQTGLLQYSVFDDLNPNISVLLIHAINPYGFSYLRRWNEDNVDINRNFLDYSTKNFRGNPGYDQLANVINPKSISFWENTKARFRLFWYGLKHGENELREAISKGQYTHPHGIFFSGTSETWSNKTIRIVTDRYLKNAERVVIIDFHTGLGPYGYAEIILNENEQSPAYKRAVKWWGDKVKTTATGESVSVHLQETLKLAFPKMLPNSEVTAVSLEFGTLPAKEVFWALREENWLHHYGGKSHSDTVRIKQNLLRAFYPESDKWKVQVWNQGKEVVEQALSHLY